MHRTFTEVSFWTKTVDAKTTKQTKDIFRTIEAENLQVTKNADNYQSSVMYPVTSFYLVQGLNGAAFWDNDYPLLSEFCLESTRNNLVLINT